jgi:hypothetical protein
MKSQTEKTLLENIFTAHVDFDRSLAEISTVDPGEADVRLCGKVDAVLAGPCDVAIDDPDLACRQSLGEINLLD